MFVCIFLFDYPFIVSTEIVCKALQVANADPPLGNCDSPYLVYKTTCTFKCHEGYILTGSKVRQCQSDRTWAGGETHCERK